MAQPFTQSFPVQWADLDPNFHVRHSVYYDWGASTRLYYLQYQGVDTMFLLQNNIGPILFREEAIFKREIRMGDTIAVDVKLRRARRDYSRWGWTHQIIKNGDTLAAIINVDGAFMDTQARKLIAPPAKLLHLMEDVPRTDNFSWDEDGAI
ncbi:acyl-CoA thioesterase [Deminuibacter soli]|uniref:Acyl-CoA thioesterase n=1 Tax=Deminuibacter soli TaxID=2291815 RepID=A0A3E1NEV7_9BACT|nr:acyl-CoA thioesterase [Deminuibacter soli]RFM26500.1 acyl-CoA thioesterase [Deminuibacter soli]